MNSPVKPIFGADSICQGSITDYLRASFCYSGELSMLARMIVIDVAPSGSPHIQEGLQMDIKNICLSIETNYPFCAALFQCSSAMDNAQLIEKVFGSSGPTVSSLNAYFAQLPALRSEEIKWLGPRTPKAKGEPLRLTPNGAYWGQPDGSNAPGSVQRILFNDEHPTIGKMSQKPNALSCKVGSLKQPASLCLKLILLPETIALPDDLREDLHFEVLCCGSGVGVHVNAK